MFNINKTAIKPSCNEKTIEAAKGWRVKGLKKKSFFLMNFIPYSANLTNNCRMLCVLCMFLLS